MPSIGPRRHAVDIPAALTSIRLPACGRRGGPQRQATPGPNCTWKGSAGSASTPRTASVPTSNYIRLGYGKRGGGIRRPRTAGSDPRASPAAVARRCSMSRCRSHRPSNRARLDGMHQFRSTRPKGDDSDPGTDPMTLLGRWRCFFVNGRDGPIRCPDTPATNGPRRSPIHRNRPYRDKNVTFLRARRRGVIRIMTGPARWKRGAQTAMRHSSTRPETPTPESNPSQVRSARDTHTRCCGVARGHRQETRGRFRRRHLRRRWTGFRKASAPR